MFMTVFLVNPVEAKRKFVKPTFSSKSFIVASEDGIILKEQDSNTIRPVASISKLMVSLIASEQDLNELIEIPKTRRVQSSIPYKTKSLTRKELLMFSLIRSDNFAAQILCSNITDCVQRMNTKARELGMFDTTFQEPTGLSEGNVSTANDLLKLVMTASTIPILTEISSLPVTTILINEKSIKIRNTNPLTNLYDIIISKTGYTRPAGGCLVMMLNSGSGQRIFILLGSKNTKTRILDVLKLIESNG